MTDSQRRKAAIARAFSLAAGEYDDANGPFFNPIGERLVRLAAPKPGTRVLDVGCGRGAVLFAAAEAVGPDGTAVGVDLASGMVEFTAADAARRGLTQVSVRLGDAEQLGFADRSFDAVLSSLALIFVPGPDAALAAAHRVLAPGGRLGYTSFGVDDPGWDRPMAALSAYLPGRPAEASSDGPAKGRSVRFNALGREPEEAAELLSAAGFAGIETVEHPSVTRYAGPEEWWRALRASGWRTLMETIPPERLPAARAAAFAELAELAAPDGTLTRTTAIRYTTASR